MVLYEAPHRIRKTLEDMLEVLGDRVIAVGRELTKTHEELVVRPISEYLEDLSQERGEFAVVISGIRPNIARPIEVPQGAELAKQFGQMTDIGGASRREALKALALKYGLPAREIFTRLEEAKVSSE
jgi:16S rRNA (cytidine1402-2'-O)-methyltransferase